MNISSKTFRVINNTAFITFCINEGWQEMQLYVEYNCIY